MHYLSDFYLWWMTDCLVCAPQENTAWQQSLNEVTGRDGHTQPDHVGTEGKAVVVDATNDGCSYSWTQNDEEVEITVALKDLVIFAGTDMINKKSIKVVFQPQQIIVKCNDGKPFFDHILYSRLDVDGCTWTLDKSGGLIITIQKAPEGETWPRLLV